MFDNDPDIAQTDNKLAEELRLAYQALLNNVLISNKLLSQETEEDDILSLLLSITRLIIDFEAGAVFKYENGTYRQISGMDTDEKYETLRDNYLKEGIYDWAAGQKRILVMPEGEKNTHILVPMITEKSNIGMLDLQVSFEAGLLRNQDLDLLWVVVTNASTRCEQIKLNRWTGLIDILLSTLENVNASDQLEILFNGILKGLDQLLHCNKYLLLIKKDHEMFIKGKYDDGKTYCIAEAYKNKQKCRFVEKSLNDRQTLRTPSFNESSDCSSCPHLNKRPKSDSYLMIVPLISKKEICGAIAIIDDSYNTRLSSDDSNDIVKIFANQVAIAIYQAQLREELQRNNAKINKEIKMAGVVQQSLLPHIKSDVEIEYGGKAHIHISDKDFTITGFYLPCTTLGGDFYDVVEDENKISLTIADVSGHGLSSSLITALFKMALHKFFTSSNNYSTDYICNLLNTDLCKFIKTGDYITAFLGILDKKTKRLSLSSAGHPYPIYYNAETKEIELIQANGLPFAMIEKQNYPLKTIDLKPGDKLFLYTDGITEAINENLQMFRKDRLVEVISNYSHLKSYELISKINEELYNFTHNKDYYDDISMLLLEMN